MRAMLRQFRRAPGRILVSVFALALAVGAIGVLAIPHVSEGALHEAVAGDGLGDINVTTTPLDAGQLAALRQIPNVAAAEAESDLATRLDDGTEVRLVRLADERTMDRLRIVEGRQPNTADEVLTTSSTAPIGGTIAIDGRPYAVVGHATTLWWADADAVFTSLDTATDTNRLVIRATDDSEQALHEIADRVRASLAGSGDTFTDFPTYLPGDTTPIDSDIRQVSTLIGLLGIVAGLVAMVLLASTTNTLITERTREVAVMRALGGRRRQLRRRLRRIALGITAAALAVGLPFGVVVSNLIARMVLEKFVGITPGVAVDWRVLAGSAVGMLLGARLVAARAARSVTNLDLSDALRDRDGAPFGRSRTHRLITRLPVGGLINRLAVRSSARRPARTVAVVAQIATAVGAAFLIPSLASSVNDYNDAVMQPWVWQSQTLAEDAGLPFPVSLSDADPATEMAVYGWGEIDGKEVELYGIAADTEMFHPAITSGRWLAAGDRGVVVSRGFATRNSIGVGEAITVDLAAGPFAYDVVGLVDDHSVTVYVDRDVLAADSGSPGMANLVWSSNQRHGLDLPVAAEALTRSELIDESAAGRAAIVTIFGAIGAIVAGVAALAVVSSMIVNLYERRHELAALQAIGARRRRIRGLLLRELAPIGALGIAVGLLLGAAGTSGIIASFESSESVDIGTNLSSGAVPVIVLGTAVVMWLLVRIVSRSATRRPIAVTLRGAA